MLQQPDLSTERYLQGQLVYWYPVLCGVADPDPGYGDFLASESGNQDGKNLDPGSGMNIPDLIFEKLVPAFWVKNTWCDNTTLSSLTVQVQRRRLTN